MHDLGKYAKKDHIEIQTRYLSLLVVASVTMVGLVFVLGLLVGSRNVEPSACPSQDPLADLDLEAGEPPPPSGDVVERLSFYDQLSHEEPSRPRLASLLARPPEQEDEAARAGAVDSAGAEASPPLVEPKHTEEPFLEKIPHDVEGVFSLQVGTFKERDEASGLVRDLERAGHEAFLVRVNMPERGGVWYRVRVGPFYSKREAWSYKKDFEERERIPAFVVKRRIKS
jgi:hypothetical protein